MTNRKGRTSKLRGSNILACAKGGTAGIRANLAYYLCVPACRRLGAGMSARRQEEIGYGG
jgi:hypothetical protein